MQCASVRRNRLEVQESLRWTTQQKRDWQRYEPGKVVIFVPARERPASSATIVRARKRKSQSSFLLLGRKLRSICLSEGALLIVAACLNWGIDNNLTRKISGSDPSQIATWKGLTADAVNTGLALYTGAKLPPLNTTFVVAAMGFLGYGVSLVLFVRALRHLGTARTGAYFSTAAFAGSSLAFAMGQSRPD